MAILYFINCNGSGHWQKAQAILQHINQTVYVVAEYKPEYISLPNQHCFIPITPLRNLDDCEFSNDAIHIKKFNNRTYLPRVTKIIDLINQYNIHYAVLDVSVDLAMLCRLVDVPYLYFAMHGNRTDNAHLQAYSAADKLLATYPKEIEQTKIEKWIIRKTHYVNGIVKTFDTKIINFDTDKSIILFVKPKGNSDLNAKYLLEIAKHNPQYYWVGIGFETQEEGGNYTIKGFVNNSLSYMYSADYVVSVAGNNSVLETAYLNKPLITKAEPRYFDEHHCKVEALKRENFAVILDEWPKSNFDWQTIIQKTKDLSPWNNIAQKDGAKKAAKFIEDRAGIYS